MSSNTEEAKTLTPEQLAKKAKKQAAKAAKQAKYEAKMAARAAAAAKKAAAGDKPKDAKKPAKQAAAAPAAPFVNRTPVGHKKDMSGAMASGYEPAAVEAAWYAWWQEQGYFAPQRQGRPVYSMVIPPPNVTGSLHLGHALTNSVQDALVRWRRMMGDDVVWVPGTDHAGIATQRVVETRMWRDSGKTRHDLGREEFTKVVWQWKEKYGSYICEQLRLLGSSLDWTREAFTMDENLSRAVTVSFIRFFDEGLIRRADRLVNWCCALETAISDIEVDYIELTGPTKLAVPNHDENMKYPFGELVQFAYKMSGDETQEIVVATTRIETMLGDTAVAVHPDDERYKHWHGKSVKHPFVDREIPIVCDAELVDMAFGTGAVKITPAHDPNDYQAGLRHKLEFISIFNNDGTMNGNSGQFAGLKRFDGRYAVIKALKEAGLHRGVLPNPMRLGLCSRTKDIIEPMMCPQWWLDCTEMAADAVKVVEDGELEIVPATHKKTWFSWMTNEKSADWCISRQLWWGHRIPVYLLTVDGETLDHGKTESWVAAASEAEALDKAAAKLGKPRDAISVRRDDDVLDTWFSSGLFPFSVFGWPDDNADLARFFPTSDLETGHDILFFWVARMVMMSRRLTGKLPFKRVLLHAMVRDAAGKKMSKSVGNVIDPMDVMRGISLQALNEKLKAGNMPPKNMAAALKTQARDYPKGIPECGTDALRYGLCEYMSQGRSINLDVNRVVAKRHFCNKLWNATRFALTNLPADQFSPLSLADSRARDTSSLHVLERWLLSRLTAATADVNQAMEAFQLGDAVRATYVFWYNELCDFFLEAIKPFMYLTDAELADAALVATRASMRETLYTALDQGLRLLHPFMPFVTEELWQRLARRANEPAASIMIAEFPTASTLPAANAAAEADVALGRTIVDAVRSMRGRYSLLNKQKPALTIICADATELAAAQALSKSIGTITMSSDTTALAAADAAPTMERGSVQISVSPSVEVRYAIGEFIDCEKLLAQSRKKLTKKQGALQQLSKRMASDTYVVKVPQNVRERDAETKKAYEAEIAALNENIENFEAMLKEN